MKSLFMFIYTNPLDSLLIALATVAVFGIVIFVHEFGHFIVAKKSGVKVDEFAFGFGPKIFSFQWGETVYSLNWIPLGGYNKFQGEVGENYEGPVLEGAGSKQNPTVADPSRDFLAQPWHRRILIALAGPFMNYLLATILFFFMLMYWGEPTQTNKTEIGQVMAGMPAETAGIQSGDVVLKIENEKIEDFLDIASRIHARAGQETSLVINRKGTELNIKVTPTAAGEKGAGLIGIRPADPIQEHKKIGVGSAFKKSVYQCWNLSRFTLYYLGQKIVNREKPDVAGPIGITQVIVKAVRTGFEDLIYLMAMISVTIGLFNLFPVPLLDGGHVLYYAIEGIKGSPVSQTIINKANMVGMAVLLSLLVFATMSDVQRLIPKKKAIDSTQASPVQVQSPSPIPTNH